jgi:hypothetical protein
LSLLGSRANALVAHGKPQKATHYNMASHKKHSLGAMTAKRLQLDKHLHIYAYRWRDNEIVRGQ